MISLDTETNGLDFKHGAKPYLVTSCDEAGDVTYWEWDVDPLTREPIIPDEDLEEIRELIEGETEGLVLQNPKFDAAAIATIIPDLKWPWHLTHDTLLAGHLLASSQPHDLTTMALVYLSINIQPLEDAVEKECAIARRLVRSRFPDWRIAKKDLPEMPSAKEKVWKFDMWLPRAVAKAEERPENDSWWTVLSDYANADSSVTLPLFQKQRSLLEQRGLWEIYLERRKLLRIVYGMESKGITLSSERLEKQQEECREQSEEAGRVCLGIAESYGYDLTLPKSGNNGSLTSFVFDVLKLEPIKVSAKTGAPSLDKSTLEVYEVELPERSKALTFIRALKGKRKRDTALSYMEGYRRYWRALEELGWYVLHPSLNCTGTATLRWSSSSPNEQNISKQEDFNLRGAFGPAPGREWWSLDAKNIELRLPAYEAGEQELIDLFENSEEPPYYGSNHLLNFHTVYPDIWEKELKAVGLEKVGPHCKKKYASSWYQYCKNGGFAVQYGAIDREGGTADKAFHRVGSHALLKARFSKLDALNNRCINFANTHGYIETMPDRTVNPKRGYPLYCSRGAWGKILPTVPLNYHIQSTACWVIMRGMIEVQKYLDRLNVIAGRDDYLIVMQIHDEIVLDFPAKPNAGNLPKLKKIKDILDKLGDDLIPAVPIRFGMEYHPVTWAEGVSYA